MSDDEEEPILDVLPPMPEHRGLVKMQLEGSGDDELDGVWRKVEVKLVSNVLSFNVPSFSRKEKTFDRLMEISAQSQVEDSDIKPLCLQITSKEGLIARICTLSDDEWGEWKINLQDALHSAVVREREASVLKFNIRRCLILDASTKQMIPQDLLQHRNPRIIKLYTALGQFDFGSYGVFSIDSLQVSCLWNNRQKFIFREKTTNNSVPIFSVALHPNDWEVFNNALHTMCIKWESKLRRDFISKTEKGFWDLFMREHPSLDPWGT
jgi:hypothetical protein